MKILSNINYDLSAWSQLAYAQEEKNSLAYLSHDEASYITNYWVNASGIPSREQYGNINFINENNCECLLKNPGDERAILGIWLNVGLINNDAQEIKGSFTLEIKKENQILKIENFKTQNNDSWIYIDFNNYTIEGYIEQEGEKIQTGNLYNIHVVGNFFEIEQGYEGKINLNLVRKSGPQYNLQDLSPQIDITYLYL